MDETETGLSGSNWWSDGGGDEYVTDKKHFLVLVLYRWNMRLFLRTLRAQMQAPLCFATECTGTVSFCLYIYICVCLCVCVCVYIYIYSRTLNSLNRTFIYIYSCGAAAQREPWPPHS